MSNDQGAKECSAPRQPSWILRALDNAEIGVWEWDVSRDVLAWTDAVLKIYRIDRASFGGNMQAFVEFVHPDDRAVVGQTIQRSLKDKDNPKFFTEHRSLLKDGTIRWIRGEGFAEHDPSGRPYRLAGVVLDVTQQKLEQEERQAMQTRVIEAQREALRQLGAPIIPLAKNALVMPLIGTLTPERAELVTEAVLNAVSGRGAEFVILDVTGVPAMDHEVANRLLRVAQALRLLGAQVALTGMQPAVARALTQLDVDMSAFVTKADLQSGITWASQAKRS